MPKRPSSITLAILSLGLLLGSVAGAPGPAAAAHPGGQVLRLHLIWTNDLHGHIAPEGARFMNPNFPPPLGGAASAAAYIGRVREQAVRDGEPVLLVDVGDMFQGTPVGTKTRGEAVIDYFNHVGYELAVPGNHDFDLGRENTARLARQSKFPWLCANIVEEATGEVVDWCRPTLLIDKGGVKIGAIGVITPGTAAMSFPANIAGLKFLPLPETVAKYRDALRAQGADLIVLAIHEGLPRDARGTWRRRAEEATEDALRQQQSYGRYGDMDLMQLVAQVPGIDVAVGGHTHQGYEEPWIDPVNHTLCFETYGNGSSLGHAILKIDRAARAVVGWAAPHDRGAIVTLFEDEIWPDRQTSEVLRPWLERTEAEMDRVVGRLAVNLTRGGAGTNLVGNLVTDAMREHMGADFALQNLGGLRADLRAGDVTARDVFSVMPFGNELVMATVPGELLIRVVDRKAAGGSGGICISGGAVVVDPDAGDGRRVCRFLIDGQPIEPARRYRVVLTNYLMEGNSGLNMLLEVPESDVVPLRITDAEALEAWLQARGSAHPRLDDRWSEQRGCAR